MLYELHNLETREVEMVKELTPELAERYNTILKQYSEPFIWIIYT
jgi:hypothetical protein